MSYYIPDFCSACLNRLISLYDFYNYDYGDDELNEYAKELEKKWFMKVVNRHHKGFSDFANLIICNTHVCELKHYYFSKEDKSGFQLVISDKKYKYMEGATPKEYAEYIYNYVLTPQRLIPRIAKQLRKELDIIEQRRIEKEKQEYPRHPERWTPEERIEKFVEDMYWYKRDTNAWSDDSRFYNMWLELQSRVSNIERAMSDEELAIAAKRYKEKYNENITDKIIR